MNVINALNAVDAYFFAHPATLGLAVLSAFMAGQMLGFFKAALAHKA